MRFEKIDHKIKEMASGHDLTITEFRFISDRPGPYVYIQSSVHGAEVQGNAVIFQLMKYLKENSFKGTFSIVPMANPMSINSKSGTFTQGRFNPQTGNNWNRNYTDLLSEGLEVDDFISQIDRTNLKNIVNEYKKLLIRKIDSLLKFEYSINEDKYLNLYLQKLAAPADIVLDLHTGPKATRYLYIGEYAIERGRDLCFPHNLIIPNEFAGAMDEACFMPWLKLAESLDQSYSSFPFEAYTVELGSEEVIDFLMAKEDCKRLLSFFEKRGIIEESEKLKFEKQWVSPLSQYKTYYMAKGGLAEFHKKPGEHFKKGDILYTILHLRKVEDLDHLEEQALTVFKAKTDGIVINHNPSAVLSMGSAVYQVMEGPKEF